MDQDPNVPNTSVMSEPAYPAARVAARRVYEYFVRHQDAPGGPGRDAVPLAPVEVIEAVIDAAFWASLRREEGYVPRMSIAILAPQHATQPLVFERSWSVTPSSLVRVSPGVERPGLHLAAWRFGDTLSAWGTVRTIPTSCCVVEVTAPGLLVIKHRPSDQSGKFVNVAALEGDQIKVVDERASTLPDCPDVVTSLLGFGTPTFALDSINVLVELAVSMRAHGRGGSLLVVPSGTDVWHESLVHPMTYAVSPRFPELADLIREPPHERVARIWDTALARAVETIAGLTAVDGATVMTDRYELIAFGAKITRRDGYARVEQVVVTEPIEGAEAIVIHPTQLGGTRHLSAAQFVQDQQGAVALVASQDGRFTVFAWSPCEGMVHAHRVETLLL